jgi:hypothetical protein
MSIKSLSPFKPRSLSGINKYTKFPFKKQPAGGISCAEKRGSLQNRFFSRKDRIRKNPRRETENFL